MIRKIINIDYIWFINLSKNYTMKKTILLGVTIFFASISFAWNAGDGGKTNTLEIHGKGSANSNFLFKFIITNLYTLLLWKKSVHYVNNDKQL